MRHPIALALCLLAFLALAGCQPNEEPEVFTAPPETVGMPEDLRKVIYLELVDAQRRANTDADAQVPPHLMDQNSQLAGRLRDQYVAQVVQRNGVSDAQRSAIMKEGRARGW